MECNKCDNGTVMILQDDSFDYGESHCGPAGTEVIKYWICPICEHDEDYEGEEDG